MSKDNPEYCQNVYGRHHWGNATTKVNPVDVQAPYYNNITRRNTILTENMKARKLSSDITSAGLKALRLYRHICRLIPFILQIHQISYKVTPIQAKIYVANHFRKNSKITDPLQVDKLVQVGYEDIYEAQMHYANTGYFYNKIFNEGHKFRDLGVDKFKQTQGQKVDGTPASGFLKDFYTGKKSHDI